MKKQTYTFPAHSAYGTVFAIVKTLTGTYVCPGWHQVPEGTTRDQIIIEPNTSIKPELAIPKELKKTENQQWEVNGSKPGTTYQVTVKNGNWSCTCPASQFRRGSCKHIIEKKSNFLKIIA